jgi:glutamate-1-semialdehyde 2,1-aminomutase
LDLDAIWNRRALDLNQRLKRLALPLRIVNMTSVWTTLYMQPSRYNWMLQYYLRAEGLTMSWVGTGRFIFSHDLSDSDFNEIANRFVAAAQAMKDDGWWWTEPALTNKAIKRRVLREVLNARLGRRPSDPAIVPSTEIAAPCGTSSRHEMGQ